MFDETKSVTTEEQLYFVKTNTFVFKSFQSSLFDETNSVTTEKQYIDQNECVCFFLKSFQSLNSQESLVFELIFFKQLPYEVNQCFHFSNNSATYATKNGSFGHG